MNHPFTSKILAILDSYFNENAQEVFERSSLLQYINHKTKSANQGSKARGSFANLYAIYVLVEVYVNEGYETSGDYGSSEGAQYKNLFDRQRQLPYGSKLQNHALNNRLNAEFKKFNPEIIPILRLVESERYWINEDLLKISIEGTSLNIARAIKDIIDEYVATKRSSFKLFLTACTDLQNIDSENAEAVKSFIKAQLSPNVDARLFEIVSFAILKYFYEDIIIFWGYDKDTLTEEKLTLFKTGRTNANDGGIDFVMKPLGKFFQVTETLDFKKYFLDIEKLQKYPITFVVKSEAESDVLLEKIRTDAENHYPVKAIVEKYMSCIEEIINIPMLIEYFNTGNENGNLNKILDEIILQSKVEFNDEEVALLEEIQEAESD